MKSLTVEFAYFSPKVHPKPPDQYTVNPEHAKSVFRLDCHNSDVCAAITI